MKRVQATSHINVYTRLAPSKIHGVGVFAIKNIPRGANIFCGDSSRLIRVNAEVVRRQSPKIKKLYNDFCVIKGDKYICPNNFNNLTVAWYLNNSKKPNVRCDKNYDFFARRNIKSGEELSVDYSAYSDEYK